MTKIIEADRAIAKAMTFRDYDLHSGPEQQVERMAEYVAAYREKCVEAERDRIRADVEALTAAWTRGDNVEVSRLLVKLREP